MTVVDALRRQGLRVTRPRVAVLQVLASGGHHDAESVRRRITESDQPASMQAVYDVLAVLVTHGLARRIEPAGLPALYEQRTGDNHHHLVCRRCGAVTDVDCATGAVPCLEPVDPAGFIVDEAEVTYWGLCPRCQRSDSRPG
ncbi:MAG: transcriptional repressor [Nocardioidaceae bacterium]|nr:transcriptional repressor [Nocardioidaceae bacterium]